MELTPREILILRSVIHSFISDALPVGSRTLSKKSDIDFSPATVRNTMADLEEMGLLEQPHTSAGRIPTDLGYRIYVDDLMSQRRLASDVRQSIERLVSEISFDLKEVMRRTSGMLGNISSLLGVVLSPRYEQSILLKVDLTPYSSSRLMAIVALKSGLAKTVLLEIDFEIDETELQEGCSLLNQRLHGMPLKRIRKDIVEILRERPPNVRNELLDLVVYNSDILFQFEEDEDFFLNGLKTLLEQPEFSQSERVRTIVELFENRKVLIHLVSGLQPEEGVRVTIGGENPVRQSRELSVLTAAFSVGEDVGTVSVIGPTRMDYSRLWSVVDYTAKTIQKQFN